MSITDVVAVAAAQKKGYSSMSSRNFPPSFWNSNYVHPTPAPTHHQVSDLYSTDGGYSTDPWHAAHYGSYAHAAHAHAAHAHAYHHNMAQYGSLLRLPQQYGHTSRLHHEQQAAHALESAAAYSSYPTMAGTCRVSKSLKIFITQISRINHQCISFCGVEIYFVICANSRHIRRRIANGYRYSSLLLPMTHQMEAKRCRHCRLSITSPYSTVSRINR
ncbi:hypothetical protein RP20_CCG015540 [Aedes albopictus]|nr:hypothetical protein RP20_CCG015540 [Aedes albopictus]